MRRRSRFRGGLLLLVVLGGSVHILGSCVLGANRYKGPTSDHFDGKRFHNHVDTDHGAGDFLRWMFNRDAGVWPDWIDAPPGPPPPERVGGDELRVTFVNHATLLLQMNNVNILTDPIWSKRSSPFQWIGPRRRRPPGIRFKDLPPIDIVLVSHNHYDHMDLPTLKALHRAYNPAIFVGLGNATYLEDHGIPRAIDVDWGKAYTFRGVRIISVPVQHFSRRGLFDDNYTLWTGFIIEGAAGRVYFSGDTGYGPHFAQTGQRFGPFRLALLPIGAFRPRWFMAPIHASPAEAIQAQLDLCAETAVAMHYGTFPLADDGYEEPMHGVRTALASMAKPPRFWLLGFGEGRNVPAMADSAELHHTRR